MSFSANILKLNAFSFLKMTLFPMAVITLFWKDHIGLSLTEILILQGFFSLATLLLEYPSGYISDRLGCRFSLNLASLLGIAGWGWYLFAGSFFEVLIAELLLGASFAFISGADSALLFETLRHEGREQHYTRQEGRMLGLAQAGEAVGAVFAGTLYAFFPLLPFIIQVVVWILALLITGSLKEPPRERPTAKVSHLAAAAATVRYTFRDNPRLRLTILLTTVLGLASYYPVWLIQPFMQETGVPLTWFGPIWAGANATVALFSWLSYRFSLRLGNRAMALLLFLLVALGYLGLALTHALWSFLFYYLLTAMRGLQGPLLKALIQRQSFSTNRASILSLKSFTFRFFFICTGPAAGFAADRLGLNAAFAILGLALCAALVLCLKGFDFSEQSPAKRT